MQREFEGREWLLDYLTAREQRAFVDACQYEVAKRNRIKKLQSEIERLKATRPGDIQKLVLKAELRKITGMNI